jgi:hypothetical protein
VTTPPGTTTSEGRVGRYVLEDLVAESSVGTQLWRASDPSLKRAVGARLVPIDDPRVPPLREAARAAARVHDRPIVQVLDVVETPSFLAIITEWVTGRPWTEVVLGAEERDGGAVIAYEVAKALQSAHALGVPHGRLRPSSVMITDDHEVRLRGLQIDAAMYGVAPGGDAFAADLHGVGAVLYSGLTGKWPDPERSRGSIDGLPVAGPVKGRLPTASELQAGVPPHLSKIASACLAATDASAGRSRIPDMDHAVAALGSALHREPSSTPTDESQQSRRSSTERLIRWLASAVVLGIVLAGVLLLVEEYTGGPGGSAPAESDAGGSAPPVKAQISQLEPLTIASATDFDPQGSDGEENAELTPLAIDGKADTAWLTVPYRNSDMQPKQGTGLLLDLGLARPIQEIRLAFVGSGTDVQIRVSDTLGAQPADYDLLAKAVGVGPELTVRNPAPVVTRYVLVWLTNLPYADGAYQGGIAEVQLLG